MDDISVETPCSGYLKALERISAALFAKTDVAEMLRNTLQVAIETTDADAGSILLYEPEQNALVFRHVIGPVSEKLLDTVLPLTSEGRCATVFKTKQAEISEEGFDPNFDDLYHTVCALTVPICNFGGDPIGVIQVLNKHTNDEHTNRFHSQDKELLSVVSTFAATVLANARQGEIEQEAIRAKAEAAKQSSLSRILGFIGHQLKNQGMIIDMARQTFGSVVAEEIRTMEQNAVPNVSVLSEHYHEMDKMLSDATEKAIKQSMVINEYGERQDLFAFGTGDLKILLEKELAQLETIAHKYNNQLDMSRMQTIPPFEFEGFFVTQAVFNLVNNAFQAMTHHAKGDTVWVRLDAITEGQFPEGNCAIITVEDNGPGMSSAILESILEGRSISTTARGSGVGTRLVHDVVLTHGGALKAESKEGTGTIFHIKLPLKRQ